MTQSLSRASLRKTWATSLAFALTLPMAAHAQMVGGGGGGSFLAGLLSWVESDVVLTLSTLAVLLIAVFMMARRIDPLHILAVCGGIWVATNASTVLGFIRS